MTKAKTPNAKQNPQFKAKDSQCKTKTPVHGKDSQCKAKTSQYMAKTTSARQRPKFLSVAFFIYY